MDLILSDYIKHPEKLDKDTLPLLCRLVEEYPYFQPARLLYLRNLYQLHDAAFDRELRRAAFFLPDRRALFQLIEGVNYRLEPVKKYQSVAAAQADAGEDRTYSLIDSFLATLPEEKPHRSKAVDASTDYMAYLMQSEDAPDTITAVPRMQHQELIDDFIGQGDKRIVLSAPSEDGPLSVAQAAEDSSDVENEDYFTETLAKIYIKQGRYTKAIEIIRRLSLKYPKKNRYFADQIRFLEKLIINNKNKKT
ncbi:MAG: hypothetical protein LUC45_08890 [Paraprevotella sp.]|nr:hypothetical protein [Paraprevotella sp.]